MSLGAASALIALLFTAIGWALPQPVPDPFHAETSEVLVQSLTVDTKSTAGRTVSLPKGEYTVYATGVWKNGLLDADPECSIGFIGGTWLRDANPTNSALIVGDWIDLYVDNKAVDWNPSRNTATTASSGAAKAPSAECDQRSKETADPTSGVYDPSSHRYWTKLSWPGGNLRFHIKEFDDYQPIYDDNVGTLKVEILAPQSQVNEELVASVFVPASSPVGVNTPELVVGRTYRLEASGTYQWQPGNKFQADAECWTATGTNFTNSRAAGDFGYDLLDVSVEESPVGTPNSGADVNVSWQPMSGSKVPGDCAAEPSRTYQFVYTAPPPPMYTGADQTTRLNLRMSDTWGGYFDNIGGITVKVFQVNLLPQMSLNPADGSSTVNSTVSAGSAAAYPVAGDVPKVRSSGDPASAGCVTVNGSCVSVAVNVAQAAGATTVPLPAGRYTLEASGTYNYYNNTPGFKADAECSQGAPDNTWMRNRVPYYGPAGSDLLDLYVNSSAVEWRAKGESNQIACVSDSADSSHVYYHDIDWAGGPMRFAVYDAEVYRTTKSGTLTVRVLNYSPIEQLLGVVTVNSADLYGSMTPVLTQGKVYRFEASGKYSWLAYPGMGYDADAECTKKGALTYPSGAHANDNFWTPHRFDDLYGPDPGDLAIYLLQDADPLGDLMADLKAEKRTVVPLTWRPKSPMTGPSIECADEAKDPQRVYIMDNYRSPVSGPINMRVFEPYPYWYTDNIGVLTVRIFEKL